MRLFSITVAASLAALANAATVSVDKQSSPLEVKLERVSNSVVKVSVKNTGAEDLRLFNKGNLLDSLATEKVHVYSDSGEVPFEGIHVTPLLRDVKESSLTSIKAGESIHVKVDAAEVYDLTKGGKHSIIAQGTIPAAEAGSTELSRSIRFRSNVLDVDIDGFEAAKVAKAVAAIDKRTIVDDDCRGDQRDIYMDTLNSCVFLAKQGSWSARTDDLPKFEAYFHTTDQAIRDHVADRFVAIAQECIYQTKGATTSHCTDVQGACTENVLSYTLPASNIVVNCPLYFTALDTVTDQCHFQDRATQTIHQFAHAPGVFSPGCVDNAIGWDASVGLSTDEAINNADSYALFANACFLGPSCL